MGKLICFTGAGRIGGISGRRILRENWEKAATDIGYRVTQNAAQCDILVLPDPGSNTRKSREQAPYSSSMTYDEFGGELLMHGVATIQGVNIRHYIDPSVSNLRQMKAEKYQLNREKEQHEKEQRALDEMQSNPLFGMF